MDGVSTAGVLRVTLRSHAVAPMPVPAVRQVRRRGAVPAWSWSLPVRIAPARRSDC